MQYTDAETRTRGWPGNSDLMPVRQPSSPEALLVFYLQHARLHVRSIPQFLRRIVSLPSELSRDYTTVYDVVRIDRTT